MKRVLLLGASGHVGKEVLDIIRQYPNEFELVGVSIGKNIETLRKILNDFQSIKYVYTIDDNLDIKSDYPHLIFFNGFLGLEKITMLEDYDLLFNALSGFVGFIPTLQAIKNNKDVALSNSETLVIGGKIINEALKENNVKLYPINSKYIAIWKSLLGHKYDDIKRVVLVDTKGKYFNLSRQDVQNITINQIINEIDSSMSLKKNIDCATMIDKGFEIIETHSLFNIPYDKIDILLTDNELSRSLVEYNDGTIACQIGTNDLKTYIKYVLFNHRNLANKTSEYLDLSNIGALNYTKMDYDKYPLVKLAKQIGVYGGNFGSILVGANEEAANLFINGRIEFLDIEKLIFKTLKDAHFIQEPDVDMVVESYRWAKEYVDKLWANC